LEFQAPDINLWAILPLTVVAVTAMVVLLLGVLPESPGVKRPLTASLLGLLLAAAATKLAVFLKAPSAFGGMLLVDGAGAIFSLMFLSAAAVAIVLAAEHLVSDGAEAGECFALLLLSTAGMMLMASGGHLVVLFLGLETMSVALYILSGLAGAWSRGSHEAALKYLLLGGFATGFLLYGWRSFTAGRHARPGADEVGGGRRRDRARVFQSRHGVGDHRVGLQGRAGTVPHVGAGCLRRCPGADHDVHVGRREGGRLRRRGAGLRRRAARAAESGGRPGRTGGGAMCRDITALRRRRSSDAA